MLRNAIDTHVHAAPDVKPRKLTDREVALEAANADMRAVVLKSHVTITADRAAIAEAAVHGRVRVLGGVVLNRAVGGLNPDAVGAALAMGGRVVWLPTTSARSTSPRLEGREGIAVTEGGHVVPALAEIFERIAAADAVLATGHLVAEELRVVVPDAKRRGVRRILVTHPELPLVGLDTETQRALARDGAMFERCWQSVISGGATLDRVIADIRAVGIESTVLATDLGQPENPEPVHGFRAYLDVLGMSGFTERDLEGMAATQPAALLGL